MIWKYTLHTSIKRQTTFFDWHYLEIDIWFLIIIPIVIIPK